MIGCAHKFKVMRLLIIIWGTLELVKARLELNNTFSDTRIEDCPGIYYEWMSTVQLQQADWRVTVFVEIEQLARDFPADALKLDSALKDCYSVNMRNVCKDLLRYEEAHNRLAHAARALAELKAIAEYTGMSNKPSAGSRTIQRRSAPLGIIGSLSKSLFGTLTSEDAEYMTGQIDRLFQDQRNITHLVEQQMHITKSQMQKLHEEHIEQTKRVEKVLDYIVELQTTMQTQNEHYALAQYNHSLSNYAQRIVAKVDNYISTLEQCIRVIAAARNGKLDPAVLTADQLLAIAKEAQLRTVGLEFPLPLEHLRPEAIASLAWTDVLYHDQRVLIIAHIPILGRTKFDLYKIRAWPVPQTFNNGTGTAYVRPMTTHIALSSNRRTYFTANSEYINNCKISEKRLLCVGGPPVHEVSTSALCELQMLINPSVEALRRCDVRIRPYHESHWIHLPVQGGWLYSLPQQENVQIICPDIPMQNVRLQGVGVLRVSPNCIGLMRSTTLTGIRTFEDDVQYIYRPKVHLNISLIAPIMQETVETMPHGIFLSTQKGDTTDDSRWSSQQDGASLTEIEEKIHAIGQHAREKQRINSLTLIGFTGQGVIIFVMLCYALRIYLWNALCSLGSATRCIKKKKKEREETRDPEHVVTRSRTPAISMESVNSPYPRVESEYSEIEHVPVTARPTATLPRPLPRQESMVY